MKLRRTKPYVCVDCDYADHHRFQAADDVDAVAGTWLRCLAYSRAQEQDGLVKTAWLRRTFAHTYARVEDLLKVGLLRLRDDGDHELHAYAPRNQTRAMIAKDREATRKRVRKWRRTRANAAPSAPPAVTPYTDATEGVTNASVPTSTSLSSSLDDLSLADLSSGDVSAVPRALAPAGAPARAARAPLPPSERSFAGPFWLEAFSDGIRAQTGRPCTVARMYLGTLERVVTHHAPHRDAPRATAWLQEQARAFAALWDGKYPAKGLTPDGLERWLNEGKQRPPTFGRPRIVQPPAEQWHADDWSDLGAEVGE